MPIYEYLCQSCSAKYEAIVLGADQDVKCPQCGSARKTLELSVFSVSHGDGGGKAGSRSSEAPVCMGNPSACGCRH